MNYRQTLALLERRGNEVQKARLGLHRSETMMQAFRNPHLAVRSIHVAGTNGKGSVAAMTESILRHGGWKTGLFTSPHLEKVEERIRIAGEQVSARRLASLATRVRDKEAELLRAARLDMPLTYFEFVTACAFLHFAQEEVDVAVVEVGLGGQLDATNIVEPEVSVITGVSIDHQMWLGRRLADIAREKAGIIKPGIPVISGCRSREVRKIMRSKAGDAGAPFVEIDARCTLRILGSQGGRYRFDLTTPRHHYRGLRLSLAGEYQTRNAALAVMAVESLTAFPVGERHIRKGLAGTRWPGRLDEYRTRPRTLLDSAHNTEGAHSLACFLRKHGPEELHFVFGVMRDKDARRMTNLLFPLARTIHLCPIANVRAVEPEAVALKNERFRICTHLHSSSTHALRGAWKSCSRRGWVVVTGSIYLLGEVLPLIRERQARGG